MVVGFSSYVLTIFVYCFCGKMATESFLNMSDCLFESDWIRLPIKFQKTIFFMIYNAQEPIYYRGFGMSTLNMQTFVKVNDIFDQFYLNLKVFSTSICRLYGPCFLISWSSKQSRKEINGFLGEFYQFLSPI